MKVFLTIFILVLIAISYFTDSFVYAGVAFIVMIFGMTLLEKRKTR